MIVNAHFCTGSILLIWVLVNREFNTGTHNSKMHLICVSYTSNSSLSEAPSGFSLLSNQILEKAFLHIYSVLLCHFMLLVIITPSNFSSSTTSKGFPPCNLQLGKEVMLWLIFIPWSFEYTCS